jgi:predicted tellurium resistance membrane protein TerC
VTSRRTCSSGSAAACRGSPRTTTLKAHLITTSPSGKRMFTPIIVVMIAIGTTDLIFALDSIPAIFGLTKEP